MKLFTTEAKAAIKKILRCMQEADAAFRSLNTDENKACFDSHKENSSLNHCTRWGLTAAEDIHAEILSTEVTAETSSTQGPYYVMINHEKSAGSYATLQMARFEGQRMCDAEPIPSIWTIADTDGNQIESIDRSDSCNLSDQVAAFNCRHTKS